MKTTENTLRKDESVITRSFVTTDRIATSTSMMLEKMCIFCSSGGVRKLGTNRESLRSCATKQAQDTIIESASAKQDDDFFRQYEHMDFIAKEAKYQESCRKKISKENPCKQS